MMAGDGDEDDTMAESLVRHAGGCWELEAWHKSPDTLYAEAKMMNISAHGSASHAAYKHDDPPTNPAMRSC